MPISMATRAIAVLILLELASSTIHFVSEPQNDVYKLCESQIVDISRHDTLDSALNVAKTGDGLLVMADTMRAAKKAPQTDTAVNITSSQWAKIVELKLKSFVEFPASLPPSFGDGTALAVKQTLYERVVVTKGMGQLPEMALLHPHKHVDFVAFPATLISSSELVIAKVAGYDNASFGLPAPNVTFPLLVAVSDNVMLAATQLSHCRTRRFAPTVGWAEVVIRVLSFVSSGTAQLPPAAQLWTSPVTPSFSATEVLPPDAEVLSTPCTANTMYFQMSQYLFKASVTSICQNLSQYLSTYSSTLYSVYSAAGDGPGGAVLPQRHVPARCRTCHCTCGPPLRERGRHVRCMRVIFSTGKTLVTKRIRQRTTWHV
jgi:hypothetical protein